MKHDVILIGNAGLGAGDSQLGGMILANFLKLLGERDDQPEYIILWNSGVQIVAEGSNWINHLKVLQEQGVKIIACRTCLEFFGLEDKVAVGEIGNMAQIQEILFSKDVLTV
jgi:selenium metabolism protein YedF